MITLTITSNEKCDKSLCNYGVHRIFGIKEMPYYKVQVSKQPFKGSREVRFDNEGHCRINDMRGIKRSEYVLRAVRRLVEHELNQKLWSQRLYVKVS